MLKREYATQMRERARYDRNYEKWMQNQGIWAHNNQILTEFGRDTRSTGLRESPTLLSELEYSDKEEEKIVEGDGVKYSDITLIACMCKKCFPKSGQENMECCMQGIIEISDVESGKNEKTDGKSESFEEEEEGVLHVSKEQERKWFDRLLPKSDILPENKKYATLL